MGFYYESMGHQKTPLLDLNLISKQIALKVLIPLIKFKLYF